MESNFKSSVPPMVIPMSCQTFKIDSLVLKLMSPYLGKRHSLCMDNYYNSVTLSNELLNKLTGLVYISKWKDKRDVVCITTNHKPTIILSTNKYGQKKFKPIEIVKYNEFKSGVDRADQMISYYVCPRTLAKSDMVIPDNVHFQKTIPLPEGYKRKIYFKTALYVSKRNIENKLHFNVNRVRSDYELENASNFTI
ncbi:hypothetical protein AGLY_016313 [Aphis glycines]|uniref:PiggyBac transposable element-derived protein domain-containing protein n=1 Tax=Aphis glycines TaxID=307491 RepID=A0A6G0SZ43_APHGL|nr:hypothetical protein AGLY_016313 [Aphis glycines]